MLSLYDINRVASFEDSLLFTGTSQSPTQYRYLQHPLLTEKGNVTIHTNETTISPNSDYAYAFVIQGVHPNHIAYKGFLYNTLLAIRLLRRFGSTADMIVYMQLSLTVNTTTNETYSYSSIPVDDIRWLASMGAHILQLPTTNPDSCPFTDMMWNKFRILQLVQYRRVFQLDSDTLPLGNLDYLFALSDPKSFDAPTLLEPNVLIATKPESVILRFLVQPRNGGWEEVNAFLQSRHPPHESSDSVLLKCFKHVLRNTSIVLGEQVETWGMTDDSSPTSTNLSPVLRNAYNCTFLDYAPIPVLRAQSCQPYQSKNWHYACHPPYRDAIHFSGGDKPWRHHFQPLFFHNDTFSSVEELFPFWFVELRSLNDELQMGLDFDNWNDRYLQGLQDPLHANQSHYSMKNCMIDWTRIDNFTAVNIIPNSTYAYSFLVGSIHENRISYKGFLWNVLLSVQILQRLGSIADFVIYLQLAPDSKLPGMPTDDVRILQAMGIHIITLPTPPRAAFSDLMFDKFHALQLTQYRRIMYLDSDVLPISNLDYLFQLSDPDDTTLPTLFQPNVMHATLGEPANGGMFVMHPSPGAYSKLQAIIARQLEEAKTLPYPHFHMGHGWGHDFRQVGDQWEAAERNGTNWNFHGGFADQGLVFYFFKYELQEATAILGRRVANWSPGPNDMPVITKTFDHTTLLNYSNPSVDLQSSCRGLLEGRAEYTCYAPYRDMIHYMGSSKPWQKPFNIKVIGADPSSVPHKARYRIWYVELIKLNERLDMGLDFENWNTTYFPELKESPLGYYPLHIDNHHRIFGRNMSEVLEQKDQSGEKPVATGEKW